MNNFVYYKNGNYNVKFDLRNGTKIRYNDEDSLIPSFPENCDVLISKRCDHGCKWCYAGCTKDGEHGNLLNWKFLDTLHPYTEMAMNLNFPMNPEMYNFLELLKEKNIIANVTVNQDHFMKNIDIINDMYEKKLIYGLGVSLTNPTNEFIETIKQYPNAVVHVINGLLTKEQISKLIDNGLKILILGYKDFGFGTNYHSDFANKIKENQDYLFEYLPEFVKRCKVVSFDNLALKQLDVRRLLTDEEWKEFYMGDDGSVTFAMDLVNGTFSLNSMSTKQYPIGDMTIDEMFQIIKEEKYGK